MALSSYIRKRQRSLAYAWQGLRDFWLTEAHARLHSIATIVVFLLGWKLRLNGAEWRWILMAVFLVWIAELMNTAIEKLADIVCSHYSPGIKRVKDMAAGGVLLAAVFALLTGLIIFLPKIILLQ